MAVSTDDLADDLAGESEDLRGLLTGLAPEEWRRPTPAAGWSIGDQVSHLAFFDDAARVAALDADAFTRDYVDAGFPEPDAVAARYRTLEGAELLAWSDTARAALIAALRPLDPRTRVPWFGVSMSVASSLTARIMETWAHAQDVADALGVVREPTARLRHVAHIGVGARAFSHLAHSRPAPEAPIRVELTAPDGATWTWGPEDAADRVTGTALDFCLAVTQRRHRDDTGLVVTGPAATEWMTIAQSFAGPPGPGRERGAFR